MQWCAAWSKHGARLLLLLLLLVVRAGGHRCPAQTRQDNIQTRPGCHTTTPLCCCCCQRSALVVFALRRVQSSHAVGERSICGFAVAVVGGPSISPVFVVLRQCVRELAHRGLRSYAPRISTRRGASRGQRLRFVRSLGCCRSSRRWYDGVRGLAKGAGGRLRRGEEMGHGR